MAGWGQILGQIGSMASPKLGSVINFGSSILDKLESDKQAKADQNSYYAALANQQQMGALATQTAANRAAFEQAMKDRILQQTGDLGSTMRAAQSAMGAMPQFDQGKVTRDYQTTKSTMMNDFNDMLKLVESQGRASQMERLGGADSYTADNDRMNALMKRYTPELQKIDDAAYDSALSRATNTQKLISTNRADTLKEIQGVFDSQIDPETKLLTSGGTDISNLINSNASVLTANNTAATGSDAMARTDTDNVSKSLGAMLATVFNKTK